MGYCEKPFSGLTFRLFLAVLLLDLFLLPSLLRWPSG